MFSLLFPLLLSALACEINGQVSTSPVTIAQGTLIGVKATDGNYDSFLGIPYAGNVSGVNRFKAPSDPPQFQGNFSATDASKVCLQPTASGSIGVEECLVLHVHTKNVGNVNKHPVMVWLHGGDFTTGLANEGSFTYLIEENIVVVAIQYRLSVFGFLCLGVEEAPGNAGLKDVIAGLKWVQQNIDAFGGDPNNVMLFGHGAGAVMVDLVTLSPLGANLIHKAIAQSGSSLSPWAISYNPIEYANAFGAKLGYTNKSPSDLATALAATNTDVLIAQLGGWEFLNNTILFAPCIERQVGNEQAFLTEAPINIIRSGNYSHIPFVTGFTNREGSLRAAEAANSGWLTKMDSSFSSFLQADLSFNSTQDRDNATTAIRNYYFSQRSINIETIEDYLDYHGDTMVLVAVIRNAQERALTSRASVRLYQFSYQGSLGPEWPYATLPLTGARHGEELWYLLRYGVTPRQQSTAIDSDVRSALVRRWANFASRSEPVALLPPGSVPWDAVGANTTTLLFGPVAISSGASGTIYGENLIVNPHSQRMTFWTDIYSKYYNPPPQASSANMVSTTLILTLVFVKILSIF